MHSIRMALTFGLFFGLLFSRDTIPGCTLATSTFSAKATVAEKVHCGIGNMEYVNEV